MNKPDISGAARALREARQTRRACPPIAQSFGINSVDFAYAAQETNTQEWIGQGRKLSGRKIGLTSKEVQRQMGVDQPDFGMLYRDAERTSGAQIEANSLMQPKAEAEIAFVLARDIAEEDLQHAGLIASIAYAVPAIELVDSAIADWKISLFDTVADNASSGLYVLGASPKKLTEFDLELAGMVMDLNGRQASVGVAAACLGNPLNAVLWLARKMVQVGRPMQAGDVILSGALGPMVSVAGGDRISVRIGGLGEVHCTMSA